MRTIRNVLLGSLALCLLTGLATSAPIIGAKADEGSDKWLLDDAEAVFVVNFKAAFKSELMTKGPVADMIKKGLEKDEVKDAIKKMGMDPTKDLDSVIISSAGVGDKAKVRVVFSGKFDKEKIADLIKKNDKVTAKKTGGVEVFEMEGAGGKAFFGAFTTKGNYFVLTESKETTVDLAKNGATKSPKKNKDLAAALKRFTGKETVAMAMIVTEEIKKQLGDAPGANEKVVEAVKSLNSMTMALTLTSGVDFSLHGNTKDGAAKGLAKQLTGLKGLGSLLIGMNDRVPQVAKDIYDDIKIDNTRDTITVSLKISKDNIEKLSKLAPGAGGD
jgi:hypothetical protein